VILLLTFLISTGCQQQTDTNTVSTDFDMQKTKSFIVKPSFELSKADLKIAQLALNFINRYREDFESLAHK